MCIVILIINRTVVDIANTESDRKGLECGLCKMECSSIVCQDG